MRARIRDGTVGGCALSLVETKMRWKFDWIQCCSGLERIQRCLMVVFNLFALVVELGFAVERCGTVALSLIGRWFSVLEMVRCLFLMLRVLAGPCHCLI